MKLKNNCYYWKYSLKRPEPVVDSFYISDKVILNNEEFIETIKDLRELITAYCRLKKLNISEKDGLEKILDELEKIINLTENIQYTEFIAFWKIMDISYSIYKELSTQKKALKELLDSYCERRYNLYKEMCFSNITVQALYDSGASRQKGNLGIKKISEILESEALNKNKKLKHANSIEELEEADFVYFLPDKGDASLFEKFCEKQEVKYEFGRRHQNKRPDMVMKIEEHFFIIEAKHIKEKGGAQDKQISELIQFIGYSEESKLIHYVSFIDGIYFNNFINIDTDTSMNNANKIKEQKDAIENSLKNKKENFFVNTAGLKKLIQDALTSD